MNDAPKPLPPLVYEKLKETLLRVQNGASSERLYQRLTKAEQHQIDKLEKELFGPESHPHFGRTVGMWMRLRGVSQHRAIIDTGFLLNFLTAPDRDWLLREIGEGPESMDDAIATRELVFDESERRVYWKGKPINVEWGKRSALWNFLCELAKAAKSRRGVDRLSFGAEKNDNYVSKMVSRLRNEIEGFPENLAELIVSAGRGTVRLDLPPEEIGLFQMSDSEVVMEVLGTSL